MHDILFQLQSDEYLFVYYDVDGQMVAGHVYAPHWVVERLCRAHISEAGNARRCISM